MAEVNQKTGGAATGSGGAPRGRTILHLDMDAFYAAVEERDHPELKGRPVVIGSPPNRRGVVSTANYEARAYGIHSAMPSRTAYRLCPQAVFLPVRMDRYLEESDRVMACLHQTCAWVEQLSVDEAFLDATGLLWRWRTGEALGAALKERIREELGLTASVGVAPNKFLAKLASDLEKPDGLTVVPRDEGEIEAFLAPLPVERLWGVGRKGAAKLREHGLDRIGDLQAAGLPRLQSLLGPTLAQRVEALVRGRDNRPVVTETRAKSLSAEHTFETDCRSQKVQRQTLLALTEHVGRRLRRSGRRATTGVLKLRYANFETLTRRGALGAGSDRDRDLIRCAMELFERAAGARAVRLIGFGVAGFVEDEGMVQGSLFDDAGGAPDARDRRLDRAVDALRSTYGPNAVVRGDWTLGVAGRDIRRGSPEEDEHASGSEET